MYPVAMLLLCAMTAVTVLMVLQNTLELLIGIKALPLSTRVSQLILNLQYTLLLFSFTVTTAVRKMVREYQIQFHFFVTKAVTVYSVFFLIKC
jgi:hypothetical protein